MEEVIRSFAPVGQKQTGDDRLDNMEWLAEVKHKKNCDVPLKLLSFLRQRCSAATTGQNFHSPAHLLNTFTAFLCGWAQKPCGGGGEKHSLADSRLAVSLFWHVTAVFGFKRKIYTRMDGDCVQWHIHVRSLHFDGYGDAKFWDLNKGLCAWKACLYQSNQNKHIYYFTWTTLKHCGYNTPITTGYL